MQFIKDYVWFHFLSVFTCPDVSVGYGYQQATVIVQKSETKFFQSHNPHPDQVWWKEYEGKSLPFFFSEPGENLISKDGQGNIAINADIFASAFYLLSGWQEKYSAVRDRYGRFPFSESIQKKYGIITLPVVNYYFRILQDAIELATSVRPEPKHWPGYNFAACLTHDIDRCESGWKIAGLRALREGNLFKAFHLIRKKLTGNDLWFNVKEIASLEEKYLARGTYFFLVKKKQSGPYPDADYNLATPKYKKLIKRLTDKNHEIAVHGNIGSALSTGQLQAEISKIPARVKGNRFHYLQYDPGQTAGTIDSAGLKYDSTLGFAEHFGFRHSYCLPFRPWDFDKMEMCAHVEIPLILMDVTLNHPNYLQIKPGKVVAAITPVLSEINKFNGCFTLLWHNENFTGHLYPDDRKVFKQIMKFCLARGGRFLTCSQVAEPFL